MTASEFAFMALGLVLGVATGAALVEVLRSRPPAPREIRVTVAPNAIARRRSATLADIMPSDEPTSPARGGPGDRRWVNGEMPPEEVAAHVEPVEAIDPDPVPDGAVPRTPVPVGGPPPFRLAGAGAGNGSVGGSVGIAIEREPDPMLAALRITASASARVLMPSGIESPIDGAMRTTSVATMRRPEAADSGATPAYGVAPNDVAAARAGAAATDTSAHVAASAAENATPGEPAGEAPASTASADQPAAPPGPCDEPKRIADERCQVATRAREGAGAAHEALRSAQRKYDEHSAQSATSAAAADPRAVRAAKESAQQAFRVARSAGRTRDDVEAAARDWLTEINRINLATREASALAERHRLAANDLALNLERLSVEADGARISAESAEEACVTAREAVAACQEAAVVVAAGGRRSGAPPAVPAGNAPAEGPPDDEPFMGSRAGDDAVIIRLLRGDREALSRLIGRLGGDDPAERRRWQTSIGALLEAFVARSIEASSFDFPTAHPFWGTFTRSQCREIAAALSSLGYRHDGFGSWADDRMPSQRDLSLAVGYAGLDPMRIRHWPAEAEMRELLREVTVAADEYVWEAAGSLSLGELVSLLGRRADGLTELWNEWGLVRPLLLAAD